MGSLIEDNPLRLEARHIDAKAALDQRQGRIASRSSHVHLDEVVALDRQQRLDSVGQLCLDARGLVLPAGPDA